MPVIDIDFDVYKALTVKRETESHTYNDVLREILGFDPKIKRAILKGPVVGMGWVSKGVTFPDGTEFRANYKGVLYSARVERGRLIAEDDKRASSLSNAARLITNNSVDGWVFWDVKRPGDTSWRKASLLRDNTAATP